MADFPTFIDWAARNWTAIMRTQFKWMTNNPPPPAPRWSFLIKFLTDFIDYYAEGKIKELADPDRADIDKIMARGVSWELAVTQLAEAKVAGALRGQMQRVALEADLKMQTANLSMERARKLADYVGNAPVHPRSRAAMQM